MNSFIKAASCLTLGIIKNRPLVARSTNSIGNVFKIESRLAHNAPNTYDFARERIMLTLRLFDKIDPNKLTLDSHFFDDLGLDSLDHVEIIMELEDEFNYEIPDKDAEKLLRPSDILRYITDKDEAYEELQRLEIQDHHEHGHHAEEDHGHEAKLTHGGTKPELDFVKRHFSTTSKQYVFKSPKLILGPHKPETSFLQDQEPDKKSHDDFRDGVMKVLGKYDKIDQSKLNISSHFFEDLGLDSLDHVEIIMELEEEFNTEIPDADAEKFFRPNDIVKYLMERQEYVLKNRKLYEDRF